MAQGIGIQIITTNYHMNTLSEVYLPCYADKDTEVQRISYTFPPCNNSTPKFQPYLTNL